MKKSILALLLCGAAVAPVATAETIWVDGVSADNGWFDANKAKPYEEDGDNNLCWVASASNLVAWWQSKYVVASTTPNTLDDIWSTYKAAVNTDTGGDTHGAVQWWISGVYLGLDDEQGDRSIFGGGYTSTALTAFDGYYMDQYGIDTYGTYNWTTRGWENGLFDFLCTDYRPSSSDTTYLSSINSNLLTLVRSGCGVGLSIANDDNTIAHAITLWGVEVEEQETVGELITKLWLTDSDDEQYGYNTNGLFSVDVNIEDGKFYINTPDSSLYAENEKVYVDGIFAIDPTVSTAWGLQLIPEPATATLGLMALAGLAVRRRRR